MFVNEYLRDFNATQAALRSGYSKKTARSIACELLTRGCVNQAIDARLSELRVTKPKEVSGRKINSISNQVYLIQEDFIGLVKIGITSDPIRRMNHLQISCPQKLTLIDCVEVENASCYEARLHAKFSEKHYGGEWFRLSVEDIETLRIEWESLR